MPVWHKAYAKLAQRKCFCRQSKRPISTVDERIRPSTVANECKTQQNPEEPKETQNSQARSSKTEQDEAKASKSYHLPPDANH